MTLKLEDVRNAWAIAHETVHGVAPTSPSQFPVIRRGTMKGSIVIDGREIKDQAFHGIVHLTAAQVDCWVAPEVGYWLAVIIPHTRAEVHMTAVNVYPIRPYEARTGLDAITSWSEVEGE